MNGGGLRTAVLGLCGAGILAIYLVAYVVAYACRTPAANLAYFIYAQHAATDQVL